MPPSEVDFWEITSPLLKLRLRQWIGAALVLWGWIHQHRCHAILVCIAILAVLNLCLAVYAVKLLIFGLLKFLLDPAVIYLC